MARVSRALLVLPMLAVALTIAFAQSGEDRREPIVITLERTPCFGVCPVYKVTLTGEGTVTYEGRQHVRVVGTRVEAIDPARVRRLAAEFERIGYFSLEDAYRTKKLPDGTEQIVTDLPTTITSIRIGSRVKSVRNYFGAPEALTVLERRIDEVAGTKRWVSGAPDASPREGTKARRGGRHEDTKPQRRPVRR